MENQKFLKITNNVMKLDAFEGYNLLYLYYSVTGETDKANEAYEMASKLGNKDAIFKKVNKNFKTTTKQLESKIKSNK